MRFSSETTAARTTTNQRLASRDRQTEASVHAHPYCDEIRAGGDVTQTDSAHALRRRFGLANIGAFNERLQIRREAQRRAKRAARTSGNQERHRSTRLRLSAGLGASAVRLNFSEKARMSDGNGIPAEVGAYRCPEDNRVFTPGKVKLGARILISGMWLPDESGELVSMTMDSETGEAKPFSKSRVVQLRSSILHRLKSKFLALLGRTE